jgi:HSP20 family protein
MSLITRGSPLSRLDPLNELNSLYDRFNALFNGHHGAVSEAHWSPAMDIAENDKEITIRMDAPGMERKDLKVEINDGALVISGERKYEQKDQHDDYLCLERGYGSFMRSFVLPDYIDQAHINAECKNGLLKVHLAKMPGKKKDVKNIAIN